MCCLQLTIVFHDKDENGAPLRRDANAVAERLTLPQQRYFNLLGGCSASAITICGGLSIAKYCLDLCLRQHHACKNEGIHNGAFYKSLPDHVYGRAVQLLRMAQRNIELVADPEPVEVRVGSQGCTCAQASICMAIFARLSLSNVELD